MFASCSAQVGPRTIFEPSYLRKRVFYKKRTPLQPQHDFEVQVGPRRGPERPKIPPRRVQDRLGSPFLPLDVLLRCLIVLGSIFVPSWAQKWVPRGAAELGKSALGGVQDGLGVVLARLSCRLAVRVRFLGSLGQLLRSFWGAPGVIFGLWPLGRFFFGSFRSLGCLHVSRPSKIDEVIPTRPGGLRAARLNPPPPEGLERD